MKKKQKKRRNKVGGTNMTHKCGSRIWRIAWKIWVDKVFDFMKDQSLSGCKG